MSLILHPVKERARLGMKTGSSDGARFTLFTLCLLTIAGLLRFIRISDRPGTEWDEPVYSSVGANESARGVIEVKNEFYEATEPYLYHPPFYFKLLGRWFDWFGIGIPQARILAAIGGMLTLVLLCLLLRKFMGYWSLVVVGLLSIDAWVVFTNRVSWIENTMMPLGILALIVYRQALRRADDLRTSSQKYFVAAGVMFAAVAVYKHIGLFFFLSALVCWLLLRAYHDLHILLIEAFVGTVAVYVIGMSLVYQDDFLNQVTIQFKRSLGSRESRGALDGIGDVIGPLTTQYAIFWVSAALVGVALSLATYRLVMMFRKSPWVDRDHVLIFSWAIAALGFFALLQLRMPHYFMMVQVPLYTYLVLELKLFLQKRKFGVKTKVVAGTVAVVIIGMNLFAMNVRLVDDKGDALRDVAEWTAASLPDTAKVVTEESVGTIIEQPYCEMSKAGNCLDADYLITYESQTQQLPNTREVKSLLSRATPMANFNGFKEEITVYKIY